MKPRDPNNRTTAALLATCLAALGLAACGSASHGPNSTTQPVTVTNSNSFTETPEGSTPDADADADGTGAFDHDDATTLHFGHPASTADATQIATLVRRYYADAARRDGTAACQLLYSTFAEAVTEDYGTSPPGPPWAQGTTCPEVLDKTFTHYHSQIEHRLPQLKIEHIRTMERQGVALLSFDSGIASRELRVSREGHQWKVLALIDNRLQ